MAKTHIVEQGEHLSGIAGQYGFRDFHTIWDHAANSSLRSIREPHCLFPGDKLVIPDIVQRTDSVATTIVHEFRVPISRLHLRVKAFDLGRDAIAGASGSLNLGSKGAAPIKTDADGIAIRERIEPTVKEAGLDLTPPPAAADPAPDALHYDLRIGHLNPVKKLSGQQARLNNLGYFAGYQLDDLEQLLWAAEEFECERMNDGKAAVKTRPDLVAVQPADQKDGQEAGNPALSTGIQDDKLRTKLKSIHGV